tara:strand:- start:2072 stop:2635 length:564 start_codon:yes stop_codon:yes gene_type:complete
MVEINDPAPNFKAKAFVNNEIKDLSLEDYKGKWVVLFFYPADFTFICPTEIGDLADNYERIKEMGAEILSISTDNVFVHKAWHDKSSMVSKVKFPMVADSNGEICKSYGTYIKEDGMSYRATVLINPEGVIKTFEIQDNSIGRNTNEIIRKLEAAQYVREHEDEVCPVNWTKGEKTLKPGLDLVGEI